MADSFPEQGRLAGIDYGTVRVGVAVTDAGRILASPLEIYRRRNAKADAEYFRCMVQEEHIVGLVVGLPVHSSGQESQKSIEARQFGRWLNEVTGLPIRFYDERYTSVLAERSLLDAGIGKRGRKKRLDKVAAQVMLAAYLESSQSEQPGALDD